jgi:copper chaperone NosL
MKKPIVALALLAGMLVLVVRDGTHVPDEVQPIAWNAEACAHCKMLIGDPAYAAQIITDDGDVLSFDDPGCAARYLRERAPHVHRAWFHAGRGDRWIPLAEVGFVPAQGSPMGSNMIAVPRTTPGAVGLEDLR